MKLSSFVALLFVLFIIGLFKASTCQDYYSSNYRSGNNDKILLSDVKTLTFVQGAKTTGRRSRPINQLECVGGTAYGNTYQRPTVVQCTNVGSDGFDAQWKCQAELDSDVKLGVTTDAATGSSKYGYQQQQQRQHNSYSAPSSFGNKLITVLIFCGIIYGVYWLLSKLNKPTPGTNGYTQQQSTYNAGPSAYNSQSSYSTHTYGQHRRGWRPGFWSGLGLGGLLGGWRRRSYGYQGYRYGSRYGGSYNSYNGGFNAPRSFSSNRSSTTRTSVGFGKTKRR